MNKNIFNNLYQFMVYLISGQQDCWMRNGASKWYDFQFFSGIMQLFRSTAAQNIAVFWLWITRLIVTRKLKVDNIIKSRTWILRFDGEYFQTAGSSIFGHKYTLGMGNYKNKALTTGCYGGYSCVAKTELMNMETLQWSNGPDFPFAS